MYPMRKAVKADFACETLDGEMATLVNPDDTRKMTAWQKIHCEGHSLAMTSWESFFEHWTGGDTISYCSEFDKGPISAPDEVWVAPPGGKPCKRCGPGSQFNP